MGGADRVRSFLAIVLGFVCLTSEAYERLTVRSSDSSMTGQSDWLWDSGDANGFYNGNYDGWNYKAFGVGETATATLTLNTNFPSGDVAFWVKVSKAVTVQGIIDGQTNTVVKASTSSTPEWVRVGVYSGVSGFASVIVSVTSAVSQTVYFEALRLTQNLDEAQNSALIDITYDDELWFPFPAVTNAFLVDTNNLLLDSSFELGLGRRWNSARQDLNPGFRSRFLVPGGTDGERSVAIGSPAYQTNALNYLYSGWFKIHDQGPARNSYTLSFDTITTNSVQLLLRVYPLVGQSTSSTATNIAARTNTTFSSNIIVTTGTGTNRQQVTLPLDSTPTPFYRLELNHVQSPSVVGIDRIKMEAGTIATPWAPKFPAEFTLWGTNEPAVYDVSATTRPFLVVTYNVGQEFERTLWIEEGERDAVVFTNRSVTFTVPHGLSTNSIPLATIRNGSLRVVCWAEDMPGYRDEVWITTAKLHTPTPGIGGWVGTHWEVHPKVMEWVARFFRRAMTRTLSPPAGLRSDEANATQGVFDFSEGDGSLGAVTNFATPMISLGTTAHLPAFYLDDPNTVNTTAWSNWVTALVGHYGVRVYEFLNEPHLASETAGNSNRVAELHAMTKQIIGSVAPGSTFIGGGGFGWVGDFLNNTWDLIPTNDRPTSFSIHNYAESDYIGTRKRSDNRILTITSLLEWAAARGITNLWNSESGISSSKVYTYGYPQFDSDTFTGSTPIFEHFGIYRTLGWDSMFRFRTILRWVLGGGVRTMVYTMSRSDGTPLANASSDTGWTLYDTVDPQFANVIWFDAIFGAGQPLGGVTNAASSDVEGYLGITEEGLPILACWGRIDTNIVLTLTETNLGTLDPFGNATSTNDPAIRLARRGLTYVVSSGLTTNALKAAFQNASASYVTTDTTAPHVQILMAPHGQDPPLEARWFATDEFSLASFETPSAVETQWSVDGSTWSTWSGRFQAKLGSLSEGNYAFRVRARDEAGNVSPTFVGPSFTIGSPATPPASGGRARVGTLRVNTLNILQ